MKLMVSFLSVAGLLFSVAKAHHVSDHVVDDTVLTKGHARIVVSQSGANIEVELYTPVVNLLDFDNKPDNPTQQNELDAALGWLSNADNLFVFPEQAQCVSIVAEVNSSLESSAGIPENSKHHEFDAYYIFECSSVEELDQIKVDLFDAYPRFKEIFSKVQGKGKTTRGKLTASENSLLLN